MVMLLDMKVFTCFALGFYTESSSSPDGLLAMHMYTINLCHVLCVCLIILPNLSYVYCVLGST